MKSFRNIRVIPVVLVAVAGLATLKVAGLVIDGGYVFDYKPDPYRKSWAEENINFPTGREDPDITGSSGHGGPPKEAPKPVEKLPEGGTPVKIEGDGTPQVSPAERAILERLQARRQEIESRQREIDIRESLLKSAEKRIEGKVEEMKAVESRISATQAEQKAAESARMKGLVTMYEGMKPKDAARVFDRLEMGVLIEIASAIAPRKMSDIMGLMSPEAAEKLTVEMARRANGGGEQSASAGDLPKIEGRPPQKPN